MRVYHGRAGDAADERAAIDADRAATERVVDAVAAEREPAVRVWRPHRQVAFGRRDANADDYESAREAARERGFPPVERSVGGRAVAYAGDTVAFLRAVPVDDPRSGLQERYDAATADLLAALDDLGVDAREGEPPQSFCPGAHSVQATADGRPRKLAGLAQRVRKEVAVAAGVLLVREHEAVADVLAPVYAALGVDFDPETVGSVAFAGGEANPDAVVATVESALVGDRAASVERVESDGGQS